MRLTESKVYIGVSGYLATKEGQFLPKGGGGWVGRKSLFLALTESFPTYSVSFAVFERVLLLF